MRWIAFVVVVALTITLLWYLGVLKDIGGAFNDWMRYIGYGGHRGPW